MGLLDRLFGVNDKTQVAQVSITAMQSEKFFVEWQHYQRSIQAQDILPNEPEMFDRMYLTVLWYASVLHSLKVDQRMRETLFYYMEQRIQQMTTGDAPTDLEPLIAESRNALEIVTYRSILYLNRSGVLTNRDKLPWSVRVPIVAQSPLALVDWFQANGSREVQSFLANWIKATTEYLREHSPDTPGISQAATQIGLASVLQEYE